ncbi:GerW family sporulation protein [Lentibacillus amyloliquefaciens]|uniref:Sporulation protein n=1 Tax=Lentibacillus amyloliquefaciens TaxID=1472767 RepID=A0A0U4FD25_9BACI|nr:GerW family sporulation protein [Lentibacillus amyloliquefaciens]ALX48365.1 sporulation protein [Lentibacillus amyloliquefaciens]
MDEHPIEGLMTTAMENLKDMTEANTIIGDAIESPMDGSVILPVSKLGFGFAAGGSEFNGSSSGESSSGASKPFGGGSGGGVSVTPVAFLIVSPKGIKMIHLDENTHIYEKLLDFAPKAAEKIQQLLKESGLPEMMKQQSSQQSDSKSNDKENQESKQARSRQDKKQQRKSQQSFNDEFDQNYDV